MVTFKCSALCVYFVNNSILSYYNSIGSILKPLPNLCLFFLALGRMCFVFFRLVALGELRHMSNKSVSDFFYIVTDFFSDQVQQYIS